MSFPPTPPPQNLPRRNPLGALLTPEIIRKILLTLGIIVVAAFLDPTGALTGLRKLLFGFLVFGVPILIMVAAFLVIQRLVGKSRMEGKTGTVVVYALTIALLLGIGKIILSLLKF